MNEIKTLKKQVEMILEDFPETRNSDITLTIKLWQEFYGVRGAVELSRLYDLPREDGVKRIRAHFNAIGRFWPTDWKVAKARGLKEDEWRHQMGYPAPKETIHPTKSESYTQKIVQNSEEILGDSQQMSLIE